jgi:flagellar biosynthesis/type III secretory pathway chaperone
MTENTNNIDIQEFFQDLQVSQNLAEELLSLLSEENAALQKMDVRTLTRTTKQKETLLVKIHYLDNRLSGAVRQGVPAKKGGKLADLIPLLPQDQAALLLQYSKNLSKLRQNIQTKNLVNKSFTNDTMRFLNDAISLFTAQPQQKNQLYGNKGMARYPSKNPSIISREV